MKSINLDRSTHTRMVLALKSALIETLTAKHRLRDSRTAVCCLEIQMRRIMRVEILFLFSRSSNSVPINTDVRADDEELPTVGNNESFL